LSPLSIASLVFACALASALVGLFLRSALPEGHFGAEARDVMKLAVGLIATTTALVLGLLTATAKSAFDTLGNEVKQSAANVVLLDRTLAKYGPEGEQLRGDLKTALRARIELTWPETGAQAGRLDSPEVEHGSAMLEDEIRALRPADDGQRALQAKALAITGELLKGRWLILGQAAGSAIPLPFLVVLIVWLCVIFGCFGLLAPTNGTVVAVLALAALAVAGSMFLILEMDHPFSGILKVPADPLRYALAQIGR
jgi:hypothetical protein